MLKDGDQQANPMQPKDLDVQPTTDLQQSPLLQKAYELWQSIPKSGETWRLENGTPLSEEYWIIDVLMGVRRDNGEQHNYLSNLLFDGKMVYAQSLVESMRPIFQEVITYEGRVRRLSPFASKIITENLKAAGIYDTVTDEIAAIIRKEDPSLAEGEARRKAGITLSGFVRSLTGVVENPEARSVLDVHTNRQAARRSASIAPGAHKSTAQSQGGGGGFTSLRFNPHPSSLTNNRQ